MKKNKKAAPEKPAEFHKLYFGYGSNMDSATMKARCPSAALVGTGKIHGYELTERLYADIDIATGSHTDGVLWSITTAADWKHLDICEGVGPGLYERLWVDVEIAGSRILAVAYIMTRETKARRDLKSYDPHYALTCALGAWEHEIEPHVSFINGLPREKTTAEKLEDAAASAAEAAIVEMDYQFEMDEATKAAVEEYRDEFADLHDDDGDDHWQEWLDNGGDDGYGWVSNVDGRWYS